MHTSSPTAKEGTYEIRKMTRTELDFAVDLAAKEGWNPGLHDADCFYEVDPDGFLIGLLDGEPVSCISVVKYPDDYSFLGFYIVTEEHRGKGYGFQIWQEGMKYLEGCNVGLDGVTAQIANYQKSGFELYYENSRYSGLARGSGSTGNQRVVNLSEFPFETVAAYDQTVFCSERAKFLKLWITRPETVAIGITSPDDEQQLSGYAVLRKCREGFKIGPLFADNAEDAEMLFLELSGRLPESTPIFLDIPDQDQNPQAFELVNKYGMEKVFSTARMYKVKNPEHRMNLPLQKWFGVTTFELG